MKKSTSRQKPKRRKVTFALHAAGAKEVILMGDFNEWNPKKHPMKMDKKGFWTKAVIIPPGDYEYKFLVDGTWKEDPENGRTCINIFGSHNSLLHLSAT